MAKKMFNKDYKNCRVSVVENDVIETYPVQDILGNDVEFELGILPLSDARKYFDLSTGGTHYIFNVDLPVKVEMEKLKLLRRSQALHNIFKYDRNKKFDLIGFMPWVILILVVLFK